MDILLIADGEGISQITDHRECWPAYSQYWKSGRKKITNDVVAAAQGLLDGGASHVLVLDGHGLDWNNLIPDKFPRRVRLYEKSDSFDGWFQVGAHSRCGTGDGFVSHTNVPYFSVEINSYFACEVHLVSLELGLIPLGVIGDSALDSQLNSFLSCVPFLPVKRSVSRTKTYPLFPDAVGSADAIRKFAFLCAKSSYSKSKLPASLYMSISLPPKLARLAGGKHGVKRIRPSTVSMKARNWRAVSEAFNATQDCALKPFLTAWGDLDLSSEESMKKQDPRKLKRLRRFFLKWMATNYLPPTVRR
jgi:D-amino peptidase